MLSQLVAFEDDRVNKANWFMLYINLYVIYVKDNLCSEDKFPILPTFTFLSPMVFFTSSLLLALIL